MSDEINPETIEKIDSTPGLRTALEVLGEANRKAHENGRCVIEFYQSDDGMTISEISGHVEALEGDE
jgi:DNA-binding transcriptional ArsR family regulator